MCRIKEVKKFIYNLLILLFVSCISIDCGIFHKKVLSGVIYPNKSYYKGAFNLKSIQLYLYNAGIEDAYKTIGDSILTDALFHDVFLYDNVFNYPFLLHEGDDYIDLYRHYYSTLHDVYSTEKIPFLPTKEFVDRINRIAEESIKYINDNKSNIKDIDQTKREDIVSQVFITNNHIKSDLSVSIWTFENNPDIQIINLYTYEAIYIIVPVNTKNYSHRLALSKKKKSKNLTPIYLQGKNDNHYYKIAEIGLDNEGNPYLFYNNQKTILNRQNSQVLIKALIQKEVYREDNHYSENPSNDYMNIDLLYMLKCIQIYLLNVGVEDASSCFNSNPSITGVLKDLVLPELVLKRDSDYNSYWDWGSIYKYYTEQCSKNAKSNNQILTFEQFKRGVINMFETSINYIGSNFNNIQ